MRFFNKRFKDERGGIFFGTLAVISIICMGLTMVSEGKNAQVTKNNLKDVTKYADALGPESVKLDEESATANDENNKNLKKTAIALVKIPIGAYDDTLILAVMGAAGVFDAKDKDKSKNTEEEEKIKTTLANNNISSDPLSVGVSKIIKKKIENSSAPDTSSKEIDDMLIKIMKDIGQQEELIGSMDSDSDDDALEDIENIIDVISHIDQTLADDDKMADQELIGLKTNLGMAEGQKKYLEEIIKAFEETEKEGGLQTEGISSIEKRLEDTNQTIKNLETEIQQYEDKLKEEVITTEETPETSADTKKTEETLKDTKKAPSIKLKIVAGPTYSEKDEVCYYRVKAEVTGDPDPVITFNKDDSGGAWGKNTVQINLKDGASYNLKATATNSEGSVTDSINLPWGCEVPLLGNITLKGTGVLTGFIDKDYYSITMNINLDTGSISGNISFSGTQIGYITETDPDTGEDTKIPIYCSFRYSSSLSGSMNLESRAITATSSGYVVGTSGGYCENVPDRYFTGTLKGTLNGSGTFASGTDSGGEYWSVSR